MAGFLCHCKRKKNLFSVQIRYQLLMLLVLDVCSGHIGAGELWETLRKDSVSKLIRNDQRFPLELKVSGEDAADGADS
jgi:hypothetical protein